MSGDLDSFLLDRVFQPIVNAVSNVTSCFGLARVSLYAAVGLQTAVLAWSLGNMPDASQVAIVVFGTLAEYVAAQMVRAQIGRMERQSRPGILNIARITYRPLRMLWVGFAVATAVFWLTSDFRFVDFLSFAVGVMWLQTVYFMCCAAMPPNARVSSSHFAFAGSGA